jgi:hypothetical protein
VGVCKTIQASTAAKYKSLQLFPSALQPSLQCVFSHSMWALSAFFQAAALASKRLECAHWLPREVVCMFTCVRGDYVSGPIILKSESQQGRDRSAAHESSHPPLLVVFDSINFSTRTLISRDDSIKRRAKKKHVNEKASRAPVTSSNLHRVVSFFQLSAQLEYIIIIIQSAGRDVKWRSASHIVSMRCGLGAPPKTNRFASRALRL